MAFAAASNAEIGKRPRAMPSNVLGKLGPAREAVFTGEGKLCLCKGTIAARPWIACAQVLRDSIDRALNAVIDLGGCVRAVPVAREGDVEIVGLHEGPHPL